MERIKVNILDILMKYICMVVNQYGMISTQTTLYLFLKVANSKLICEGKEVEDIVLDVVIFEVVHQVSTIALQGEYMLYKYM